jgi:predicted TIM-barrel fold metal-dependent hydrolase
MRIDVQAHFSPREYLKVVQANLDAIYPSIKNFRIFDETCDIQTRMIRMKSNKIDKQILCIPPPGVDRLSKEAGISLAKLCNDQISQTVTKYPDYFEGLAVLPLQAIDESLHELHRAVNELGLKGIMINSNTNWKPLDSPEFFPVYEAAGKLGAPIFIHPAVPTNTDFQQDYGIYVSLGFIYDSSLAMLRLIQSGTLDRFPKTNFILGHLGGVLPYVVQRIDELWLSFPPQMRGPCKQAPSSYFRRIYLDTMNNFQPAHKLAKKVSGPERLLFGTDYPYPGYNDCVNCIESLELSEDEKAQIFCENAIRLFNIE